MDQPQAELKERLSRIGNICVQWSNVEYQVAHVIWRMLALNMETGKLITGGLDMLPRINMAIALARHLKAPRFVELELVRVRKAIQDGLDVERNRAVHGINFTQTEPGGFPVEMHRGKGPKTPVNVSNATLARVGNDLNKLGNALADVHKRLSKEGISAGRLDMARKMLLATAGTASGEGSNSERA